MLIKDVLKRDLKQKIEEIIQVDQTDEQSVYNELTEYVATDRIRDQYQDLLRAIAEAPTNPDEGIGVWISGFFGSGKSSFAKNLGYVLANRDVLGEQAANIFKQQVDDQRIAGLVDFINAKIPTEVVMFDVQKDRSQGGQGNLSISPYMYRVLLRELGYAEDFDVAELEISLEGEGRLDDFIRRFNAQYASGKERDAWDKRGRSSTEVWNRAGRILHEMDPGTYPAPESFAHNLAENRVSVSPRLLVDHAFELMSRRRPGKALVFIIDEVGQYVAYSQERLEDLRAVVETFGRESKNRIKARKAIAPVWMIVTAQEKLDEVTSAMGDDKRVLIAKVRDRFRYEIDLSPADIREVATRRVLSKTDAGAKHLEQVFRAHQGQLNAACRLERTTRKTEVSGEEFNNFYPYLPHYIELSIDIMSGIRLQPGATRHIGGSNRTIIGQVYQMLVNPRTDFANKQVGALVSLDKLYELVEGQIGSAKQKDISDIVERFKTDPQDQGWTGRVAKVVALLEFVRDLPRSEANIAAVLIDKVGQPAPTAEVKTALQRLVEAQFVRNTEEGYKLQTAQEKNWTSERNNFVPKPKDRNEIKREMLGDLFGEPRLKTYNFNNMRNFRVGITVDGVRVGSDDAQVPLTILTAEEREELPARVEAARSESRSLDHQNDIYWVFALTPEIDDMIANLYASRQMIAKYDQMRSQTKITHEESISLGNEKSERDRIQSRLRDKMSEALGGGQGLFRGISKDASDLGKQPGEMFKRFFDIAVPDLYPKLEMGARNIKGTEAEDVLKAANLNGLSQVFYDNDGGLGLVIREGQKYVPNPSAAIAKEMLDYLKREHSYGNKVTGKSVEDHFQGIGYGWDRDMLRLVLAVLLRAGAIEVTHQGRRFRNHLDPQSRVPLVNNTAFKAAAFAPRESIDLQTLVVAVRNYEQLTGDDVDVEEGAIAAALKKLAADEMNALLPVIANARANSLPITDTLESYRDTLLSIQSAASDDCVRILVGEGKSLKQARDNVRDIREATSDANLALLRQARTALEEMAPTLHSRTTDSSVAEAVDELRSLIAASDFFTRLPRIKTLANDIRQAYRPLYLARHQERYTAFTTAIDEIKGRPEWALLTEEMRDTILLPLSQRACASITPDNGTQPPELLPGNATRCVICNATVSQIESDIAAVSSLRNQALVRLQEMTAPPERPVKHVRIATFFSAALDSNAAVDTAIERLKNELYKLVAEGAAIIVE